MTKAQIIAAIAAQITGQTAADSITPTIVGNLLTEITNQLPQVYTKVDANNYLILPTDYVLSVNNGNQQWMITLPSAALYPGKVYIIKRYDQTSTGLILIESSDGDVQETTGVFVGIAQILSLWGAYDVQRMFQSNGTAWEYIT